MTKQLTLKKFRSFSWRINKTQLTLGCGKPRQEDASGDDNVENAQKVGKASNENLFRHSITFNFIQEGETREHCIRRGEK